jgi:hypothetical protein
MKLFLIIAAVGLCLAINPAQKPDQHANESKATSNQEREPSVVIFNDEKTSEKTYSEPQERPKWYRTVNWSNWALVLVALATAYAVWKQAVETANAARATRESAEATQKAAEAARDSVRLQERAMAQWVDITNWRSELIAADICPKYADGTVRKQLRVRVDILNQTSYPLTLTEGEIIFSNNFGGRVMRTKFYTAQDFFLTPCLPHTADVPIDISDGNLVSFEDDLLNIRIDGGFSHIGVLEKPVTQPLVGNLVCGKSGTRFDSEMPMNPRTEEDKKHQKT